MHRTVRLFAAAAALALLPALQAAPQATTRPRPADDGVVPVRVHAGEPTTPLELWRHALGHGGINALPLPDKVIDGTSKLHPRLVRVFIQEFFNVYPEHDRYDWKRLDPYMDALSRTGAKVVAAITIKPRPLYPTIDQSVWRPSDVGEWQRVVAALVKRYSVDKPIVTHWEVGNETDIGENGGCPYLIRDPADYAEFYRMTIEPILAAFPGAKVGGPAVADADGPLLPGFIGRCAADDTRLDFVSWHVYSGDPDRHAALVTKYRTLLDDKFPCGRPEMFVTEWNKGFERVSVEERAFAPRRAAAAAATILALTDAGIDWSFYYHLWDQTCYVDDFKPFFADPNIMYHHWNEVPHRFGLFGVAGEVRPQYFVYQMLSKMGTRRLAANCDDPDLRTLAGRDGDDLAVLLVNYNKTASTDRIAWVRFDGLTPGATQLRTWRIDGRRRWSARRLELRPTETREVDVRESFACPVSCPADSVTLIRLDAR
jgi:hypothetical protein